MISALVCFVALGLANVWLVLIIIFREFMVTSIRLVAVDSGVVIAANRWGKVKTVSQVVAILVILLLQYLLELAGLGLLPALAGAQIQSAFALAGNVFLLIATFFAVLSGGVYLKQNWGLVAKEM